MTPLNFQSYVLEKMNTVFVPKQLVTNASSEEYGFFDTCLRLYLSPAGVLHKHEVLIYDMGDLVGDIGGFLGLFLGASIVSLYDEVIQVLKRRLRSVASSTSTTATEKNALA